MRTDQLEKRMLDKIIQKREQASCAGPTHQYNPC